MPFFHSRYLKDDKKAWAAREVSQVAVDKANAPSSTKPSTKQSSRKGGASQPATTATQQQQQPSTPQRRQPSSPSRLVWHSNVGSALTPQKRAVVKKGGFFSAFQYSDPTKKKTVHFATIEVQPYNWDYTCDKDVYYSKTAITAMNKQRFTDASKLRKQRNIKVPSKQDKEKAKACDDVDIAKRTSDIQKLLEEAFDPERDIDEDISIRGIEHFVYPALQQEMIRRKKHAKREIVNFRKEKRPDPRGWRLARLSEVNTQWAREVAIEKGMRYCMNQEAIYGAGECGISKDELERSKDELDNLRMLKSSASCVDGGGGGKSLEGGVADITKLMKNVKMAYSEDNRENRQISQSAGADTRED